MHSFILTCLLILLVVCNIDCDTDRKLLKLKEDVEKIGSGFENLAFDVMGHVIDEIRPYNDYYSSGESTSKEVITQHPVAKKISNTTQVYTKRRSVVNEQRFNTRHKRSVEDNVIPTNNSKSHIENATGLSSSKTTPCPKKTLEEQMLERQHIEDLKEEVKKLYDLVVLLKDQQKIMSLLNEESKHLDSDMSKRFDTKDLLTILDHVNDKDVSSTHTSINKTERNIEENDIDEKTTHEELKILKFDLKGAISALNKTKEILAMERKKEIDLENEMKDHRIELNFLKLMIQRLYENNTGFHAKKTNSTADDIVGAPLHLPKELPTTTSSPEVKKIVSQHRTGSGVNIPRSRSAFERSDTRPRPSDLDDLDRLLHELRKPRNDELESRMMELRRDVQKIRQEQDIRKQLETLEKFIAERSQSQGPKGVNSESDMVKRLMTAINNMEKPQSKIVDDDVELELQKLQNSIDKLRPKDDWETYSEKDDVTQIQKLLSRLLEQQSKQNEANINENKAPQLSPKQISDLRKQLDEISNGNTKGMAGNMYTGGNGYGYGYGQQFSGSLSGKYTCKIEALPQSNSDINSSDLYGRGPTSQFLSGGLGNLPRSYPTPNRKLSNSGGTYASHNIMSNNANFPSSNKNYQSQNFGINSSLRPSSLSASQSSVGYDRNIFGPIIQSGQNGFQGNAGQHPYQSSSQSQGKQFGVANHYNYGTTIEQTTAEQQGGQINVPAPSSPYNVGHNIDQGASQSFSESHQSLSGINSGQTNINPLPYSQMSSGGRGQNTVQTENKNQFFLAPQSSLYGKPTPNSAFAQSNAAGSSQNKPGYYPQENTGNTDYRYQKFEDIRSQVDGLHNVISNLNKPGYVQESGDQETIASLEQQINDLKGIMRGLTQGVTPNAPNYGQNFPLYNQNYQPQQQQSRRRRGSEDADYGLNIEYSDLYDQVVTNLRQAIFENNSERKKRSNYYDDVQKQIADLKSQLDNHFHKPKAGHERHFNSGYTQSIFQNSYLSPHYGYGSQLPLASKTFTTDLDPPKKDDLFTSIALNIVDKLLASAPAILQRIFGYGFSQLINFGNTNAYSDHGSDYSGGYNVDYGSQNGVQNIFKNFGIFGNILFIFLKIIDGITAFVNVLKKNKFFKNFLLPALVLLVVAGSVIFLIWWLQPNDDYIGLEQQGSGSDYNKNYGQYSDIYSSPNYGYEQSDYGYGHMGNYGAEKSYNRPAYSRNYLDNNQ